MTSRTAPIPSDQHWVSAAPFRAQLRHLCDTSGVPWPGVAVAATISLSCADHLLHGNRGRRVERLSSETARRILAINPAELSAAGRLWLRPGETRLLARRLLRSGWQTAPLAVFCQLRESELRELVAGRSTGCSQQTAWLMQAAEQLLDARRPALASAA